MHLGFIRIDVILQILHKTDSMGIILLTSNHKSHYLGGCHPFCPIYIFIYIAYYTAYVPTWRCVTGSRQNTKVVVALE